MRKLSHITVYVSLYILLQIFRISPFFVVYSISWFFYFLAYRVVGYRRKVVLTNLRNAFPEWNEPQIRRTARKFYRNFIDVIAETMKGFVMSDKSLLRRFRVINPELPDSYLVAGKSIVPLGAHYCNHEWGKILGLVHKHPMYIVYSPFTNPYVDRFLNSSRKKFGMKLVAVNRILRVMTEARKSPHAFIMGVDQRPFDLNNAFWLKFLNQDTACHTGYEQLARKFNHPVFYMDIQRVKKGHYTLEYKLLCEEPGKTDPGTVITLFMKSLEEIVRKKPEDWLWSHKRWKYSRKEISR